MITKLEFSEEELRAFGLSQVAADSYVKVELEFEDKYFTPAAPRRIIPVLEAGNLDPMIALPDDTGWEVPGDQAGPYRFPLARVHPELQLAVSPRCTCADKMRPWSCALIECTEIASCIKPPAAVAPVVMAVLATSLGLPAIYTLACQEGFLRVLHGTRQEHPRPVVLMTCTPQAQWQGDAPDMQVSCLLASEVIPAPPPPPTTRPETTLAPTTAAATVALDTTTARMDPITSPAGTTSVPLLTTPAPVDYGEAFVNRDITGVMTTRSGSRGPPGCDIVYLHIQGLEEDGYLSTVLQTHICAAAPAESFQWHVTSADMQVRLAPRSLLGGSGGMVHLQSENVEHGAQNAAGLGVVVSPQGNYLDVKRMVGSWEGRCSGSCRMQVQIEGLLLTAIVDNCQSPASAADEGRLVAAISQIPSFALDFNGEYEPSHPQSEISFVYTRLELTILETSSPFWATEKGRVSKGIFYFPSDEAMKVVMLHPGEDFVSSSLYPLPNSFLPSYSLDECKSWNLVRNAQAGPETTVSRQDVFVTEDASALSFVPNANVIGWAVEVALLKTCAAAVHAVQVLAQTVQLEDHRGMSCDGLLALFMPEDSGAKYAYLFDRVEVRAACSSSCAPAFEALVLQAVNTCSEVWKSSRSWSAARSRSQAFQLLHKVATARYRARDRCTRAHARMRTQAHTQRHTRASIEGVDSSQKRNRDLTPQQYSGTGTK